MKKDLLIYAAIIIAVIVGAFAYDYSGNKIEVHAAQMPASIAKMVPVQTYAINDFTILPCTISEEAVISIDGQKEYPLKPFQAGTIGRQGIWLAHGFVFQLPNEVAKQLTDSAYVKVKYSNGMTHKVSLANVKSLPAPNFQ